MKKFKYFLNCIIIIIFVHPLRWKNEFRKLKKEREREKLLKQIKQPILWNNSDFYEQWQQAKNNLMACQVLLEEAIK